MPMVPPEGAFPSKSCFSQSKSIKDDKGTRHKSINVNDSQKRRKAIRPKLIPDHNVDSSVTRISSLSQQISIREQRRIETEMFDIPGSFTSLPRCSSRYEKQTV